MNLRVFRRYVILFLQWNFSYRIDIVLWIVNGLITPLIMMSFWIKLSESQPHLAMAGQDFIAYFFLLTLVVRLTQTWSSGRISTKIKEGDLSNFLVKPVGYMVEDFAHDISTKTLRLVTLAPFLLILFFLLQNSMHINAGPIEWLLFFLASVLGYIVTYCFANAFGLLAFYLTDISGLQAFWSTLTSLFTGGTIPIILLPGPLGLFARYFYTRFYYSFPLEIVLGQIKGTGILIGFVTAFTWIIFFETVRYFLWRRGVKKFTGIGL